jgi:hypothetical protein
MELARSREGDLKEFMRNQVKEDIKNNLIQLDLDEPLESVRKNSGKEKLNKQTNSKINY